MATARRITVQPTPVPPDEIVLTLTEDEAAFLSEIMYYTGSRDAAPGYAGPIYRALKDAKVRHPSGRFRFNGHTSLVISATY